MKGATAGHGLEALRRALRRQGGAMRISPGPAGGVEVTLGIDLLGAAASAHVTDGRPLQVRNAIADG